MRVLVLINFVLVAAAVVLAYMGYTRVETARTTAQEAADGLQETESRIDRRLKTTEQGILEQVTDHARAEAGRVEAKLSTRVSDVETRITDDVRGLADGLAKVAGQKGTAQEQVLNRLATLNKKIADLQEQVKKGGAGGAGGADLELRKRVATLEREFAKWLEIILPPEVAEAR